MQELEVGSAGRCKGSRKGDEMGYSGGGEGEGTVAWYAGLL